MRLLSSAKAEKSTANPLARFKEIGGEKRREVLKGLSEVCADATTLITIHQSERS